MMMGIFLGAMGDMSPAIPIVNGREAPQAPATEQVGITRSRIGGSRLVTAQEPGTGYRHTEQNTSCPPHPRCLVPVLDVSCGSPTAPPSTAAGTGLATSWC